MSIPQGTPKGQAQWPDQARLEYGAQLLNGLSLIEGVQMLSYLLFEVLKQAPKGARQELAQMCVTCALTIERDIEGEDK